MLAYLLCGAVSATVGLMGWGLWRWRDVSKIKAAGCYQCGGSLYFYGSMDTFFEGIKLRPGVYVCKTCDGKLFEETELKQLQN
jgi:hypothetical protein